MDHINLYKKHKELVKAGEEVASLEVPPPAMSGWSIVSEQNYAEMAKKIPPVSNGVTKLQRNDNNNHA